MPPKKSSTSTTNSSQSSSTVGLKRKAAAPIVDLPDDCSEELRLFYWNCEPKGTIFEAKKSGIAFFNTSIQNAVKALSKEDRLFLLKTSQEKSLEWKANKAKITEKYTEFYSRMDGHWREYLKEFTTQERHNFVDGDYFMSDAALADEAVKLGTCAEIANEELTRRECSVKDDIWQGASALISAMDYGGDTRFIHSTHSSQPGSVQYPVVPSELADALATVA